MFRIIFAVLIGFALVFASVPSVPVLHGLTGIHEANAQQWKKKRKTLFDLLFKRRQQKSTNKKKRKKKNRLFNFDPLNPGGSSRSTVTSNGGQGSTESAPKVVVVKREDAPKVLVVGDFIAGGMASGLVKLYAENPDIVVVNKSKANSGIVRDDVVDWPTRTKELIEELNPVAVIILVGMNDRQQMRTSKGRVSKLSDAWTAGYNKRVEGIATAVTSQNLPLVWVGLPPVRSNAMSSDYLVFNEIFRTKTEAVSGSFVDVWDGFTNAEGKFVSAGPDIKGQIVRLRGSKGINMTRAGKAKLAFYADKALRRLGIVQDVYQFISSLDVNGVNTQTSKPEYDPVGTGKTVVIPLGGAVSDGGIALEGEANFYDSAGVDKSVSYSLVEQGVGVAPTSGRIDAQWGKPTEEAEKDKKAGSDKKAGEKTSSLTILPKVTQVGVTAN